MTYFHVVVDRAFEQLEISRRLRLHLPDIPPKRENQKGFGDPNREMKTKKCFGSIPEKKKAGRFSASLTVITQGKSLTLFAGNIWAGNILLLFWITLAASYHHAVIQLKHQCNGEKRWISIFLLV